MKWLDRRISAPGPFLTLCTTEVEYQQALKHCKVKPVDAWIKTPQANATTHVLIAPGGVTCIVCINVTGERTPLEIAGILVHEAVHVWQEYRAYYGEDRPGVEQEAYAIQAVAQELMRAYSETLT